MAGFEVSEVIENKYVLQHRLPNWDEWLDTPLTQMVDTTSIASIEEALVDAGYDLDNVKPFEFRIVKVTKEVVMEYHTKCPK